MNVDYSRPTQPVHLIRDGRMIHPTMTVHPEQLWVGTGTSERDEVTCPVCEVIA